MPGIFHHGNQFGILVFPRFTKLESTPFSTGGRNPKTYRNIALWKLPTLVSLGQPMTTSSISPDQSGGSEFTGGPIAKVRSEPCLRLRHNLANDLPKTVMSRIRQLVVTLHLAQDLFGTPNCCVKLF